MPKLSSFRFVGVSQHCIWDFAFFFPSSCKTFRLELQRTESNHMEMSQHVAWIADRLLACSISFSVVMPNYMPLQVVLCGQSYDATAALFTTSMQHPAVKGCVALYPFW